MTDRETLQSRHDIIAAIRWCRRWPPAPERWSPEPAGARRNRHPRRRRAPSPIRRAISARAARRPPISGIPTSSRSIRASTASRSRTRRSSGCGPGRCGRKGRHGAPGPLSASGATSRTTGRCAGSEDDGRVSVFRTPSNNSNGNTFDFQGRQLSCEHLTRRVVRYEHDGTVDGAGRRLRGQAAQLAERRRGRIPTAATGSPIRPMAASCTRARRMSPAARAIRPGGSTRASASRPASCPAGASCRPTAIASIRAAGSISSSPRSRCRIPNGLCFSPDYKKLYVA